MKNIINKIMIIVTTVALSISLFSCKTEEKEDQNGICVSKNEQYGQNDIYVTEDEKKQWYDAIVKLISNQEEPYGEHGEIMGYEAPRPNEPSIAPGLELGLFDITNDGVPELFQNMGGGSAGNDFFIVYDIFSGKKIAWINGGGEKVWSIYYDIQNDDYTPIGRYDWRSGYWGSEHYINTINYDEECQKYYEKNLFYSEYQYNIISSGDEEFNISDVLFKVNGKITGFQEYHYALTKFYQEYSLIPHTGLKIYYWSDVSDNSDSYQVRAEKMADMLLFGSGQKFVKIQ